VWSDSGIGVILGDRHCALDIDHHPGGADGPAELARLQAEHGALPNAWHATSPAGGGGHMYFANHGRFTSVHQVAPGIQLRAGRHVMVLPPTHGREWLTSPRQAPLPDLPVWVADLAQRKRRATPNGGYRVAEELLPDNRHPTYVHIALELARLRLPAAVIAEMLAVVDQRMARPPKEDSHELDSIAAWAVGEVA
jgi:Bifunctional DNA primase/polymerase, N-terminal